MEISEREYLTEKAKQIRKLTIETLGIAGGGHLGGSMSIIEILTILYYRRMKCEPDMGKLIDKDRLILSKGHAGPALYSILADKGFFPKDWLQTLNEGGTNLPSHCDMQKTPGIDMTTGSLGQGLSAAIGMALAYKLKKWKHTVYLILGDGECNEGQIWEGAMAASHYKLDNIIAFVDYNKLQIDGPTSDVMNLDDITSKWNAFGWFVLRVNGHDLTALDDAVSRAEKEKGRPRIIIADTIKGKGAFFAEGKRESHKIDFGRELAEEAVARIY